MQKSIYYSSKFKPSTQVNNSHTHLKPKPKAKYWRKTKEEGTM